MIRHIVIALGMALLVGVVHAQAPSESAVIVPELAVDPVGYEITLTVQWSAPEGHAVSEYLIWREPADGSEPSIIAVVLPPAVEHTISGHTDGDTYRVQAHAYGPRSDAALPWCDELTNEV